MEGCEICTLSPSIDGHLSHISIFLLTMCIYVYYISVQSPFLVQRLYILYSVSEYSIHYIPVNISPFFVHVFIFSF